MVDGWGKIVFVEIVLLDELFDVDFLLVLIIGWMLEYWYIGVMIWCVIVFDVFELELVVFMNLYEICWQGFEVG